MDAQSAVKNLHQLEIKILLAYDVGEELTAERLRRELDYKEGHANQAFSWLAGKGLAEVVRREPRVYYEITQLGKSYAQNGTPEARVVSLLAEKGAATLPELAANLGLDNKDVGSAFGALSKENLLTMDADKRACLAENAPREKNGLANERLRLTAELLKKGAEAGFIDGDSLNDKEKALIEKLAKKRGAADSPFRISERETVVYALTDAAREVTEALKASGLTGAEIGALTPETLERGSWKNKAFRAYNIAVPPARTIPGRLNPYASFLESVKDKLVSLGFEEFDGPLVETEFWNSDALFMPQFHAARDIHDAYSIKSPSHAKEIEEPYLSNIAAAHENGGATGSRGWRYSFDREFTKRLILRSQGTALSARQLPKAKIPGKYFGIVRCFRYDKVDATHLSDFYQTEGIAVGPDVNFRTLLGFLKIFAEEIAGAKEVKYVPGYFPFTEPSVEVHIKHPSLGWIELGGSGIFRPEVSRSLGVDAPVLAWGIGIDRMALMALGLNDLRELFSNDIERVRLRTARI